ncbi:MAG: hypothetical protein K2I31_01555 [Duncaniella sp.]|nr:hypothetical protein [Duncaniella sp.]
MKIENLGHLKLMGLLLFSLITIGIIKARFVLINEVSSVKLANIEALTSNSESDLMSKERVKHTWQEEWPNPNAPDNPIIVKFYQVDCYGEGKVACTPDYGML